MSVGGFSAFFQADASNWGTMFIILDDFKYRTTPETQATAIAKKLNVEFYMKIMGCRARSSGAPPVPGLGQSGGFQLQIEDLAGLGLKACKR